MNVQNYKYIFLVGFRVRKKWTSTIFEYKYINPGESVGLKFIPSQSELFRFIPITIRTNPKNVLYLFWWKAVKNQSDFIGNNPRPSFQSRLIRINAISDWSKPNEFKVGMIRIDPRSDWYGLILIENLVSDTFGLMSRN